MKVLYLLIVFSLFGIQKRENQNIIELKILDKYLIDGRYVNVELKNNTPSDYCFVMDTIYYERDRPGFDPTIRNIKIILLDKKNKEVPLFRDVYLHDRDTIFNNKKDSIKKWSNPFKILTVKSGKAIKLKIPFNLIVNYKFLNQPAIFQIDKNKKYLGRVEYMIQKEYLEKYISEEKKDSLYKNGAKFFVGSLKSNEIPLLIRK